MALLFIGRFQPFHNGHAHVLTVLRHEEVIVGIGSAYESHSESNPFTAGERVEMIVESGFRPLAIVPIPDINRYALWVRHVESLVPPFDEVVTNDPRDRRLFAEAGYSLHDVPLKDRESLNATHIRALIANGGEWRRFVPAGTADVIDSIEGDARIRELARKPLA